MSKLADELIEDEDRESWEYDYSIMLACQFIKAKIIPLLEEFEENNTDKNYVDGTATHALFITLMQILADMGFSEEELVDEVATYVHSSAGETIH